MILTWSSSLILSIGATAVLEIAAATPPAKKSLAKEIAASAMMITLRLRLVYYKHDILSERASRSRR